MQFELRIHDAMSLKDKRRVVKSLKDRLHREHMVSVAEVGAHEVWNAAVMGVACVSGERGYAADVLERIAAKVRGLTTAEMVWCTREVVGMDEIGGGGEQGWQWEDGTPLWTPAERREEE